MRAIASAFLIGLAAMASAAPVTAQSFDSFGGQRVLRCESKDGRVRQCAADTRGGVRVQKQLSRGPCIEGDSWGVERDGVWVSKGCRAEFALGGDAGRVDSRGHARGRLIRCDSGSGRSNHCDADTRRGVELVRQLSRSSCMRDQSWGWDERGIWVSGGCRAEFRIRAGRGDEGDDGGPPVDSASLARSVRCESNDGHQQSCALDTRGGARMSRQLSRTPCVEGRTWGYDRRGVWVDRGCRADFESDYRQANGWH